MFIYKYWYYNLCYSYFEKKQNLSLFLFICVVAKLPKDIVPIVPISAITSIRRRNDTEKSTWRTHRYCVDFESQIHVEKSTSNRYHNFHVDSPFKIDVISTNFPRGISMSNRWRIDEDVSMGYLCRNLIRT